VRLGFLPLVVVESFGRRMVWLEVWCYWLNFRPDEAIRGKEIIIGWEVEEWYVDIRGSKVVAHVCVD
jgi:hypothetical protein